MHRLEDFRAEYARLSDEALGARIAKALEYAGAHVLPSGAALREAIARGELRGVDAAQAGQRLVEQAHALDTARGETGRGGMEFELYDGGLMLLLEVLRERNR